jgi:hypothetical protein
VIGVQRTVVLAVTALAARAAVASAQDVFRAADCSLAPQPTADAVDDDADAVDDRCEQALAERFAPVVYHSSDESNFPTNVGWVLGRTTLWFYDYAHPELTRPLVEHPGQEQLVSQEVVEADGARLVSGGTRSANKLVTFYLDDVDEGSRKGSQDSGEWATYVHVYPNDRGGVTVQYWRFYAYNDALNNHGGDWEGMHVVLGPDLAPAGLVLLDHEALREHPPGDFTWEGTHPRIFSEGGGHATRISGEGIQARGCGGWFEWLTCRVNPDKRATFVRQESWSGGRVEWFDGRSGTTGPLLNVGEKRHPLNGQLFVRYSGLWGTPSRGFPPLPPGNPLYIGFSGYWGPAYNETGMDSQTGFSRAWADGMLHDRDAEGRPDSVSP